jgi:hypothetical protein
MDNNQPRTPLWLDIVQFVLMTFGVMFLILICHVIVGLLVRKLL